MVEAIRHFKDMDSFKSLIVKCKRRNCMSIESCAGKDKCMNEPHYKTFVSTDSRTQLSNVNSYSRDVWKELITDVFNKQPEKHIAGQCAFPVAVLSAFLLFVLDYYGCEGLKRQFEEA